MKKEEWDLRIWRIEFGRQNGVIVNPRLVGAGWQSAVGSKWSSISIFDRWPDAGPPGTGWLIPLVAGANEFRRYKVSRFTFHVCRLPIHDSRSPTAVSRLPAAELPIHHWPPIIVLFQKPVNLWGGLVRHFLTIRHRFLEGRRWPVGEIDSNFLGDLPKKVALPKKIFEEFLWLVTPSNCRKWKVWNLG